MGECATPTKYILLVEDSSVVALQQQIVLEEHGFTALTATSGVDAVDVVRRDPDVELILMDIELGRGMDGIETARRILDVRKLPIVFLTSHAEPSFVDSISEVSRYGYVLKSSPDIVLIEAIRTALDIYQANEKTIHDERLAHQAAMERRTKLLERAEELAGLGSWEWDIQTDVWTMSKNWYRIHGLSEAPMETLDLIRIAHPEDRTRLSAAFDRSKLDGRRYDIEHRIVRADTKEVRTVHAIGDVEVSEETGKPTRMIGSEQDITERRQAEELKAKLAQRDRTLTELNHRVKNNLAMVSALVNLKDHALGDVADLSDIRNQVNAIAFLHERLYEADVFTHVEIAPYIRDLLSSIFSLYPGGAVSVSVDVVEAEFSTKAATTVGLIVNEFATNAMKHGFTEGKPASFSVTMTREEETFVLTVSNSGRPFPEEHEMPRHGTLGMELIFAMVSDIDGTLSIRRRNPSPVFAIRFPVSASGMPHVDA